MLQDVGGVPAVQMAGGGYGYGDGMYGGGGMWAIVLMALLFGRDGFGRDGRGGDCCCGNSCCDKELGLINDNMNARFNETDNVIRHNADLDAQRFLFKEVCDTNTNISTSSANLAREIGQLGFQNAIISKDAEIANLECCCATQRAIDNVNFNVAKEICGTNHHIDTLDHHMERGFCNVERTIDKCCCDELRAIDSVKFQNEKDTCAIISANAANTQRILDWMQCNELKECNEKLEEKNQLLSEARIIAAMKPVAPIPSYTVQSPYAPYSPQYGYGRGFDGRGFNDCCGNCCC